MQVLRPAVPLPFVQREEPSLALEEDPRAGRVGRDPDTAPERGQGRPQESAKGPPGVVPLDAALRAAEVEGLHAAGFALEEAAGKENMGLKNDNGHRSQGFNYSTMNLIKFDLCT